MLTEPSFMNARIFPSGFFDEDFKQILAVMPESNPREISLKDHMKGIWKTYNSSEQGSGKIILLKEMLDETDRRHKTDWKTIFPWLVDVH
jgi:hypothetical protein